MAVQFVVNSSIINQRKIRLFYRFVFCIRFSGIYNMACRTLYIAIDILEMRVIHCVVKVEQRKKNTR